MSENLSYNTKASILGVLGITFIALFLFVGRTHVSETEMANTENTQNPANGEFAVVDDIPGPVEVTAEKVIPHEEDPVVITAPSPSAD